MDILSEDSRFVDIMYWTMSETLYPVDVLPRHMCREIYVQCQRTMPQRVCGVVVLFVFPTISRSFRSRFSCFLCFVTPTTSNVIFCFILITLPQLQAFVYICIYPHVNKCHFYINKSSLVSFILLRSL